MATGNTIANVSAIAMVTMNRALVFRHAVDSGTITIIQLQDVDIYDYTT